MNDIVSHGVHDPEEFPFLEELHVLRRLKVDLVHCASAQVRMRILIKFRFLNLFFSFMILMFFLMLNEFFLIVVFWLQSYFHYSGR